MEQIRRLETPLRLPADRITCLVAHIHHDCTSIFDDFPQMEPNLIISCGRQRQACACEVGGSVEVEIDSGIVEVNVCDSGLVGVDDVTRAFLFGG